MPILVTGAALGGLPLLLIVTLALVAVYSPDPSRREAAEKVLDRLLTTLRPRDPVPHTPRRPRRPRSLYTRDRQIPGTDSLASGERVRMQRNEKLFDLAQ